MTLTPTDHPSAPDHEAWIDIVRATACLMVVMLHASAKYVTTSDIQSSDWAVANAIDSATRVCVPLFFMISGYLFFGKRTPKSRHVLRVVASIAVYSGLAIGFVWAATGHFPLGRVLSMPYQPVFYHLWYLYAVLGIYLAGSVVTIRPAITTNSVVALLILMFVLNGAGLAPKGSDLALEGRSIIYLLLAVSGAVLGQLLPAIGTRHRALVRRFAFVAFWLCVIGIAAMTYQSSAAEDQFVATYYGYTHPLVIGAAFSCFSWLRLAEPAKILMPFMRRVADHSLAIYGIHAIILAVVRKVAEVTDFPAIFEIPTIFMVVLLLSYAIACALRSIDPRKIFT